MKHVTSIKAATKPFDGFWMKSAYRIPLGKFPLVSRFTSQDTNVNTPITEMVVNSLITSPTEGASVHPGAKVTIGGIAWDGGYGIRTVEVSTDGGKQGSAARDFLPKSDKSDFGRRAGVGVNHRARRRPHPAARFTRVHPPRRRGGKGAAPQDDGKLTQARRGDSQLE
jgi:Mo-co oxidoreductase dimerisation domain